MRARLARLSVRSRLTLLAGAAAAVVLTTASLLFYAALGSSLNDAVTAELRIRAQDVAAELEAGVPPVLDRGPPTQLVTPDGQVLRPEGSEPFLHPDQLALADRPRTELVVDTAVDGVGDDARVLAIPAQDADGNDALVLVAGSTAPVVRARAVLALVLGVGGPIMVGGVAVTAWLVTRAALNPVRRMSRRATTLSLHDPSERLPVAPGNDEIAELGTTLNVMLGRIADTVAHERTFLDDASHELRTPLAVLRGELELARADLQRDAPDVVPAIDSALEETDRLVQLTDQLLALARADAADAVPHEPIDVLAVARDVVGRVAPDRRVEVVGEPVIVPGDPTAIDRMLTNLVTNAVRWSRDRVQVKVAARKGWALVRVSDDGPGFDPELGDRAFDRFGRAGSARSRADGGAGLGLAIVASTVRSHGGRIELASGRPLGGARVEVRLPRDPS